MRALLRTRLAGGGAVDALIVVVAAIASFADWAADDGHLEPMPLVLAASGLALLAGLHSLGVDLDSGGSQLLEHLPVARWRTWLAAVLPGALIVTLVIVATCWHRTLAWEPPRVEQWPGGPPAELASRWLLSMVAGSAALFLFGAGLFGRVIARRRLVAPIAAFIAGPGLAMLTATVLHAWDLSPTTVELAPLMAITGALLALGSFVVMVRAPPHLPASVRGSIVTATTAIGVAALAFAALRSEALRWQELSPDEHVTIQDLRAVGAGSTLGLVAEMRSDRSGAHLFAIDLAGPSARDLGRGIELHAGVEQPRNGDLSFLATRTTQGLGLQEPWLFIGTPASGFDRVVPAKPEGSRGRAERSHFAWTQDGQHAAFEEQQDDGSDAAIVVDRRGGVVNRMPLTAHGSATVAGNLVAIHPDYAEGQAAVIDPTRGTTTRCRWPYRARLTPDGRRVIFQRARAVDGVLRYSVVALDVATQQERVLIGEDDFPSTPDPGSRKEAEPRVPDWLRITWQVESQAPAEDMNEAGETVFLLGHPSGELLEFSVELVDAAGVRRTLVPPSAFAPVPLGDLAQQPEGPQLFGFVADGRAIRYLARDEVVIVDVATGARAVQARREPGEVEFPYATRVFSPSGRRVIRREGRWGRVEWLDEERLAVVVESRILLVAADDLSHPLQLYPVIQ